MKTVHLRQVLYLSELKCKFHFTWARENIPEAR